MTNIILSTQRLMETLKTHTHVHAPATGGLALPQPKGWKWLSKWFAFEYDYITENQGLLEENRLICLTCSIFRFLHMQPQHQREIPLNSSGCFSFSSFTSVSCLNPNRDVKIIFILKVIDFEDISKAQVCVCGSVSDPPVGSQQRSIPAGSFPRPLHPNLPPVWSPLLLSAFILLT